MQKPRIFVGSSKEGMRIGEAIQLRGQYDAEITVWTDNIFQLSCTSLQSLLDELRRSDAAIFVFTPDDVITVRDEEVASARDNVIFELGLAIGVLGPDRSFIVKPRSASEMHLPTDLIGFTAATYDDGRSGTVESIVAPVWTQIRSQLEKELYYDYPERGYYGPNILHGNEPRHYAAGEANVLSVAARTPDGRSLRVEIIRESGTGDWMFRPDSKQCWRTSIWNSQQGRQAFDCPEGGTPDLWFFFNGAGTGRIEIYEHGDREPRVLPVSWG